MNASTNSRGGKNKGTESATSATQAPVDETPRIVKRIPHERPDVKSAKERALAGTYRVIHGSIMVPRPKEEWLNADGSEKPHVSKVEYALPGDEVYVGNEDAARMIDADIIEPLDAKPSRVGKVWAPPPPVRNKN